MITKSEKGSFTIEAILSLSLFMLAFVSILALAAIVKVESTTQYAIDQVAKEISQYYYIAEKAGISNTDGTGDSDIDSVVQAVVNFTDKTKGVVSNYSSNTADNLEEILDLYSGISNDVSEVTSAARAVYESFGIILENPKGVVSSLAVMMAKEIENELVTKIIAQPICKVLVTRYITSNENADSALKKMGVIDGVEGLDFRMSSFLTDQRSINVVLIYQVKLKGFGLFNRTFTIKQTASTAAWVTGVSLKEAYDSESIWAKDNFERGKEFVAMIKAENPLQAVKPGVGIDLYSRSTNTFTSIYSVNVFSASYSDYQRNDSYENNVGDYSIKKDKIKALIKGYARDLLKDINKTGEQITMLDDTQCYIMDKSIKKEDAKLIIIVPEDAKSDSDNLKILNEIAKEIENETGVRVNLTYREKALGG